MSKSGARPDTESVAAAVAATAVAAAAQSGRCRRRRASAALATAAQRGCLLQHQLDQRHQEDVIYANEHFQSLEFEGPVLKPGDLAIWIRHDDVVHYQKRVYAACLAFNAGLSLPADNAKLRNCKTNANPCELIEYQSLSNTTTTGGDGLTGQSQQDRIDNEHDADNLINDKFAVPNKYMGYNGDVLTTPDPYHQYDYGGRMYYTTSVKLTCCAPDENAYDLNDDGSFATLEDKAMQHMCPPPENSAQERSAGATRRVHHRRGRRLWQVTT